MQALKAGCFLMHGTKKPCYERRRFETIYLLSTYRNVLQRFGRHDLGLWRHSSRLQHGLHMGIYMCLYMYDVRSVELGSEKKATLNMKGK